MACTLAARTPRRAAPRRCIQGCACEAKVYDAHHELKESQLYTTQVLASQAEACVMTVTVLNDTSSGSHKFKVGCRAGMHPCIHPHATCAPDLHVHSMHPSTRHMSASAVALRAR